jgi:ribosomal protein L37E
MQEHFACSECGAAVADSSSTNCSECGYKGPEAEIRQESCAQGLHALLYEGLHARVAQAQSEEKEIWPEKWHVYLVIDPENDKPFYVGMTGYNSVNVRLSSHLSDRASAVKEWAREHGRRPKIVSIGQFNTMEQARRSEETLIAFLPNLVNRDVEPTRRRVKTRLAA